MNDPRDPNEPTVEFAKPAAADPADAPAADPAPEPDAEWLSIKVVEDEEEARLIVGFLQSNGFDARIDSRYSHEFPSHMGGLGEIEIELPAAQAAKAKRLLDEREATPLEPVAADVAEAEAADAADAEPAPPGRDVTPGS